MSPQKRVAILRSLRPEDDAASSDHARRARLEWRILCTLERAGLIRPLDGRRWTRAQLLDEALRPMTRASGDYRLDRR